MGSSDKWDAQLQNSEVYHPLCCILLIKEVFFFPSHSACLVSVWKHQQPFPGPCLFFFNTTSYIVSFAYMQNPNYILSHPCILFQYKIIVCCEVGKFQTPFGSSPWSERRASQCLNLFTKCTKDMPPPLPQRFLKNEALHGLSFLYIWRLYT